jgi:hypothetical protein
MVRKAGCKMLLMILVTGDAQTIKKKPRFHAAMYRWDRFNILKLHEQAKEEDSSLE